MEISKLEIGTRIYYRGDMANCEGFGEITAHNPATRFRPVTVTMRLDDGRVIEDIAPSAFGIGQYERFQLEADYEARRREGLRAFALRYSNATPEEIDRRIEALTK